MRVFILTLFASGVVLALMCGIWAFFKNSKLEETRKQLKETGIHTEAIVVGKEFKKTRRIIHITGRLQNFDSFLLKLKFNALASEKNEPAISFNKALRGEDSVKNLRSKYVEYSKDVGKELYNSVQNGDVLPVLFLKERPEDFELLEKDGGFTPNYMFWISIGCFLFSGLSLLLFVQYYKTGTTF